MLLSMLIVMMNDLSTAEHESTAERGTAAWQGSLHECAVRALLVDFIYQSLITMRAYLRDGSRGW